MLGKRLETPAAVIRKIFMFINETCGLLPGPSGPFHGNSSKRSGSFCICQAVYKNGCGKYHSR